jgi:hypothetical protein
VGEHVKAIMTEITGLMEEDRKRPPLERRFRRARGLRLAFWFILNCFWPTIRGLMEEGVIPWPREEEGG